MPLDYEPGHVPTYRAQVIMCAHHSALFRFEDGRCIEGPCAGAKLDAVAVWLDAQSNVVAHCGGA
ncbi:nitrite reductase/ring-hydroxylating ferredoxin subunit [Paraburkholderia silvatlantica]|uniref:Nitrite reductase/ring-hydroxylating ferredoxin subunit n=1 Tax=Paraburkholderia silvatlantica TaxID=321895 RepID=A0ABR6FJ36_9BURK|nr:nitrite reductase/ring-hydroxylating ferredoxin subunit [Paraburkholderia silvatlantica]